MSDTRQTDQASGETALEELARASLDDSVSRLDAATLSRLNQARQQALEESRRPLFQRFWLPISAAAFAMLALAVVLPLQTPETPAPATEYISATEDAELMEDLDLVLWLMEEDHAS